jgi:hypothetical protein
MVITYLPSDAAWHKKQEYIWLRGGDLNGFKALPVLKERNHPVMSWPIYDQMFLDTKNQEYVWITGEDLNSFQNILVLPVWWGTGQLCTVMTMSSAAPWHKEQEYIWLMGG